MYFTNHFSCIQNVLHNFSRSLILDGSTDSKEIESVWNKDVLGGFFRKIDRQGGTFIWNKRLPS